MATPVLQYSLDGKFLRRWDSISEATAEIGLNCASGISQACKGKKRTAGGFIWEYEEDTNEKGEKWKTIVYDFIVYEVSNKGRVKTARSKPTKGTLNCGYLYFHNVAIHRLVAKAFCEGYAEGKQVRHLDNNLTNNNANNLQWFVK